MNRSDRTRGIWALANDQHQPHHPTVLQCAYNRQAGYPTCFNCDGSTRMASHGGNAAMALRCWANGWGYAASSFHRHYSVVVVSFFLRSPGRTLRRERWPRPARYLTTPTRRMRESRVVNGFRETSRSRYVPLCTLWNPKTRGRTNAEQD